MTVIDDGRDEDDGTRAAASRPGLTVAAARPADVEGEPPLRQLGGRRFALVPARGPVAVVDLGRARTETLTDRGVALLVPRGDDPVALPLAPRTLRLPAGGRVVAAGRAAGRGDGRVPLADAVAAAPPPVSLPLAAWVEELARLLGRPGTDVVAGEVAVAAQHLHVDVPVDVSSLAALRSTVRSWLTHQRVASPVTDDVVLAVDEAVTNAMEHAYRSGPPHDVAVRGVVRDGEIRVRVEDRGSWRAPHDEPQRGRGLTIMRTVMDGVRVASGAGGTTVVLRRRVEVPT